MGDPRVENLAKLLVNYCVEVGPGDKVMLRGVAASLPLVSATYREIIRAGGHATLTWDEPIFQEILLREGNDDQLKWVNPAEALQIEDFDCYIRCGAPENTRALSSIPAARQNMLRQAQGPLLNRRMERAAAGDFRWVGTLFPTQALAQDADMSLGEYEDFVYGACFADRPDPVAAWQEMSSWQQKLVDWLCGKKEVVVKGPNVDLTLSIDGRTFINSDGHRNMPSGEIFTGPVEESVNGWVRFDFPAIYAGREVEGIELKFVDGVVTEASAKKNEDFLISALDTDSGSRILGEFAVGTNNGIQRFTRSILFDEKIGGTIHMAVGSGYPDTGSKNRSALHWDMICDMRNGGQIHVDGELFYDSGRFLLLGQ